MSVVMTEPVVLARLEQARTSLAEVTSVPEAKTIRDQAEALRYAAKQADASLDVQNLCAELKLRAERRVGELLAEVDREPGKRTDLTSSQSTTRLQEMGITRDQSSRWQKIASIPEPEFEQHIEERKQNREEITTAGVIRLASSREQRDEATSARMWDAVGDPDGKIERAKLRLSFANQARQISALFILNPEAVAASLDEQRDRDLARTLIDRSRQWFDRLDYAMDGEPRMRLIGE